MNMNPKRIIALLGPTNTGKTYVAIEKMLEHETGIFGLPLRLLAREVYDKCVKKVGIDKVALITDGRFSGATRGFCVGHVSPEAAVCGPIALIEDGDEIILDAEEGKITLNVSQEILDNRKKQWKQRKTDFNSGTLWKYSKTVGSAAYGAVTHPGAEEETHVYGDI